MKFRNTVGTTYNIITDELMVKITTDVKNHSCVVSVNEWTPIAIRHIK